ncbi:protein argonaute 4A-like isoform X2 [Silene latifolia]|uniref:protein argonaute 4A-like isoform X2 n=1 Tax=Silene latifolia TaxID=37657 RepID=UPI003D77F0A9
MASHKHESGLPPLPPLVPGVTPIVVLPEESSAPKRVPMPRRGLGTRGQNIRLLTNHLQVRMPNSDNFFYQYSVKISYEDGHPVEVKGIGRKVLDKVLETYGGSELHGKQFAYDGEKTLFSLGPLVGNSELQGKQFECTVVLEDQRSNRSGGDGSPSGGSPGHGDKKRLKRPARSKIYKVNLSYAAMIPLKAITDALRGQETEQFQDAVRVLDIILRQNAARTGCLLVRQCFFRDHLRNFVDIGGGVLGCRGFHSSFRATQGGLSLNMDVSTTTIVQPGPLLNFLVANQNVRHPQYIDWTKAKRTLRNLRISAQPTNMEYKITGLSDKSCRHQTFELRQKNSQGEYEGVEITVYDYFLKHRNIDLRDSADFPCVNVGKPKRPVYIPVELCSLVSLQRYTKALSGSQRTSLVENSRQKPRDRMAALTEALNTSNYGSDPLLRSSGIAINNQFLGIEGRVLTAPKLRVGNGEDLIPQRGRWNFNKKTLLDAIKLERWAILNFSARVDMDSLKRDLVKCGQNKGMRVNYPLGVFFESSQDRSYPAEKRVDMMLENVQSELREPPQLLLCILSDRKNSDIYGPLKKKCLVDLGVVTQCIAPKRLNDQYLTNVLLKINAKLDGLNSKLAVEAAESIPLVSGVPTLIIGMDVSHGSPGRADIPSIAAVVSSRRWPSISCYRAAVRTQSPKLEIIDGLFKPVAGTNKDEGMVRELLYDFHDSSSGAKPEHIIIFRDGVSESQFSQVLNKELDKFKEACKYLQEDYCPKFTLIVAQKNHHTRFFLHNSPDNVPPGTVIDNTICHPRNNDFFMCAQAGMIGTSRPTHYHVLHDEIGFAADDLQELVHSLSYVYQRSTTAISVVMYSSGISLEILFAKLTISIAHCVWPVCNPSF